jgi:6-phosphogluconolactonase
MRFYLSVAAALFSSFAMSTANSAPPDQSSQTKYLVYIGTYGKGVYAFRFDSASASVEPLGMVGAVVNPSWVTAGRDYKHLYAVSELDKVQGAIAAFGINRKTGALTVLNSESSGGEAPCYAAVDHTGKVLIVANYVTGGVSSYPIERDGRIGRMASLMTAEGHGPNEARQEGPHAHEAVIAADNKRVYVPDLGLDHIRIYRLDPETAKLVPNDPPYVQEEGGSGPRHIVFSKNGKYAYLISEIKPVVTVLRHDETNGSLEVVQTAATLPRDFSGENTGAEIRLDPDGKFLYTSNRGADTIQVFAVDPANGTIRMIQTISTQGKTPRGFALDPTGQYLLVGNQASNNLVVMKIDRDSGKLIATGQTFDVPSPVDVLFVPAQ